jgi:3-carboxy-cis,cis-muconate cycloisomerase
MSFTLANSGYLEPVAGDSEIAAHFSAPADLAAMLAFENALAQVQADEGIIPASSAQAIEAAAAGFAFAPQDIAPAIARNGLAVPALIDALRERLPSQARPHLHFGATSQDVIDTSLMLRAKAASGVLTARLARIIAGLDEITAKFGTQALAGRTRMQKALPITAADRLGAWRDLAVDVKDEIDALPFPVQLGGPVGTLSQLGGKGAPVRAGVAARLGLADRKAWHSNRLAVVRLGDACSHVSGALGKIGADIALMAQNEVAEIRLSGSGGSSAMPHKQNPVRAEILVALARYNATQVSALHQSLVHENERSGAAWTLEWMVLPQMFVTAGASTRATLELLQRVEGIGA